jgi:alkaline phosphatase D
MMQRREVLKTAALGLGALLVPTYGLAASRGAFTHGIASGEPEARSVLLWTRYLATQDSRLRCEVATDRNFRQVVGGGETMADPARDHTARLTVEGLRPDRWYFYRFVDRHGQASPVGRTRTLPESGTERFGIGLFSCSNLGFGFFNAYAHAAERRDLDLVVHVGDYLYEYARGTYPDAANALPSRPLAPEHEIVSLADYRARHAVYRNDADLQRLHARYPMVCMWDDHELTNDAWRDGAENHQPATEGDWETRKRIAQQAYRDWMPVADDNWRRYQIGELATLFKIETRITGRSAPLNLATALQGRADTENALVEFRDHIWSDGSRTLLGTTQEQWLYEGLRNSQASGTKWQVLAQQVVTGSLSMPAIASRWLPSDASPQRRQQATTMVVAATLGLPFNFDSWDGFPAARRRLFQAALESDSNLVVLSGDSHNAWGQNLGEESLPDAGVEFACHAVTSPGMERYLSNVAPAKLSGALLAANPGLVVSDTSRRGYVSLSLTAQSVSGTWHFLKSVRERNLDIAENVRATVQHGQHRLIPG